MTLIEVTARAHSKRPSELFSHINLFLIRSVLFYKLRSNATLALKIDQMRTKNTASIKCIV